MKFILPALLLLLTVSGCRLSSQTIEFDKAGKAFQQGDYAGAVKHYGRVASRNPSSELSLKAARRAAEIASLQAEDYPQAIRYYRHLVIHSPDVGERKAAQEKIARVYFDKMGNYRAAIVEIHKVLDGETDPAKSYQYKFLVARSYFYLNNFFQARVETDELLKLADSPERKFQALLFKANVFLNDKKIEEALKIFEKLAAEHPEMALVEKIHISIAVCHEELGNYSEAIRVLEDVRERYANNQFVELKIARLKQRKENQPSVHRRGK